MDTLEQQLYESMINEAPLSNMISSTSQGTIPAMIKMKGGSKPAITKLITKINAAKQILFVREFTDNGAGATLTIGRPQRPAVKYVIQRIANPSVSLRANSINAQMIADGNGDKLSASIALAEVITTDNKTIDVRKIASMIHRDIADVKPNMVVGVSLDDDQHIDQLYQAMVDISKMTNTTTIISRWAELVNATSVKEDKQQQ